MPAIDAFGCGCCPVDRRHITALLAGHCDLSYSSIATSAAFCLVLKSGVFCWFVFLVCALLIHVVRVRAGECVCL
jgi:hypothetical protein